MIQQVALFVSSLIHKIHSWSGPQQEHYWVMAERETSATRSTATSKLHVGNRGILKLFFSLGYLKLNTKSLFFLENQTSLMILLFLPAVLLLFQDLSLKFISEVFPGSPLPPPFSIWTLKQWLSVSFIWWLVIHSLMICLVKQFKCPVHLQLVFTIRLETL